MLNGKAMITHLIDESKSLIYYKNEPILSCVERCWIRSFKLCNKAWRKKSNKHLIDLKPDVDKLDIDKLKSLPTDLNNLKCNDHKLDVQWS